MTYVTLVCHARLPGVHEECEAWPWKDLSEGCAFPLPELANT